MSIILPPKWCGVEHQHHEHRWVGSGMYQYCPGSAGMSSDTFLCDACGHVHIDLSGCPHENLCTDCADKCPECNQDRADDKAAGA